MILVLVIRTVRYMRKLMLKPFNDIWYQNCFMHAILPIIRYNGVNLEQFLHGERILYYLFNNSIHMGLEKVQNLDYYLSRVDCKIIYMDEKDPIRIIQNLINQSIPVMVWVDCFYLSKRRDTFNKTHLAHCLLVHGYDSERQELIIFDHEYANDIKFAEKRIAYNECLYSMQKYKESYKRNFHMAIISREKCYIKKEFEYISDYKKIFWNVIENEVNAFQVDKFEKQVKFFGKYERLLRILEYVNKVDYSAHIQNASLIKVLFGKAMIYCNMPEKNKERILDLYDKIHI